MGDQSTLKQTQEAVNYFKNEAHQAKTKTSYLQLELDKRTKQLDEKERLIEENKR